MQTAWTSKSNLIGSGKQRRKWPQAFIAGILVLLVVHFGHFQRVQPASVKWWVDLPSQREAVVQLGILNASNSSSREVNVEPVSLVTHNGARFLIGVFTTFSDVSDVEFTRREVIRRTAMNNPEVCSLTELWTHPPKYRDCRLVYTFVAGAGDGSAPTERMDPPLTVPHHPNAPEHQRERDVTWLNIQENMNQGKSQTWFKFATTVAPKLGIDYIGKMDSDTVLFPACFLEQTALLGMTKRIPNSGQSAIFSGGKPQNKGCDKGAHTYFYGSFYFMDSKLAFDITSDTCDRRELTYSKERWIKVGCRHPSAFSRRAKQGAEDSSMGNFVAECSSVPVHIISMRNSHQRRNPKARSTNWNLPTTAAHSKLTKDPNGYERLYNQRSLLVKAEYLHYNSPAGNDAPKYAVCLQTTLESNADLFSITDWTIYQRLLGFSAIYIIYTKNTEGSPNFAEMISLPILKGTMIYDSNTCGPECQVKYCIESAARDNYDWVLLLHQDEYLWYNQSVGIEEFMMSQSFDNSTLLSFPKVMYSTNHRVSTEDTTRTGFGVEDFPFGTKQHSRGLSRVMVRLSAYKDRPETLLHLAEVLESEVVLHVPVEVAHLKQWSGTSMAGWSDKKHMAHVMEAGTKQFNMVADEMDSDWNRYLDDVGRSNLNITLQYDAGLRDWFQFVANDRGAMPPTESKCWGVEFPYLQPK